MMEVGRKILIALKGKKSFTYEENQVPLTEPSEAQRLIHGMLLSDKPCMIARFGSVELQAVVDYMFPPTAKNAIRFVKGEIPSWGYAPSTKRTMHINAGFFPATKPMLDRFGQLMQECMPLVDMLGSWRKEEAAVMHYLPQTIRVPLYALEPYYFDNPWTPALEGKKVLVIHPFEDTIRKQHEKGCYEHLFADKRLMPNYELQTLKAVQSIAGNKPDGFDDWFQALQWMETEIDKRDFDIAIIGCGAYGFPLAAYVKRIGKKAVHLGGAAQYLFGIRSNASESKKNLASLINEKWVRPSQAETPKGIEKVENSRYW
ncbi:MAG: hypothetical protein IJK78_07830 [Bacteroidales bacterium]|nr:hypothetical protein [Bacteroidales bacterium]